MHTFTNYRVPQSTLQASWSKCLSGRGTRGSIKTKHLTNLKNRSIFGLCFGTEGKIASVVFIALLTLKRRVIRKCESASAFGCKQIKINFNFKSKWKNLLPHVETAPRSCTTALLEGCAYQFSPKSIAVSACEWPKYPITQVG